MTDIKRPTTDGFHGAYVTTPRVTEMMQIVGIGHLSGNVAVSKDEFAAIKKLYGFKPERPNKRPPPPTPPKELAAGATGSEYYKHEDDMRKHKEALKSHAQWTDPQPFMQAGADRNAMREAECDGLRLLAWLARYVPAGEDPMKTLIQLALDAHWDVDPIDVEYADG